MTHPRPDQLKTKLHALPAFQFWVNEMIHGVMDWTSGLYNPLGWSKYRNSWDIYYPTILPSPYCGYGNTWAPATNSKKQQWQNPKTFKGHHFKSTPFDVWGSDTYQMYSIYIYTQYRYVHGIVSGSLNYWLLVPCPSPHLHTKTPGRGPVQKGTHRPHADLGSKHLKPWNFTIHLPEVFFHDPTLKIY